VRLVFALASISRPFMSSVAGLGAAVIVVAASPAVRLTTILATYGVVTSFCAYGFIVNDIWDVEKDRVGHPERMLPAGILTLRRAVCLATFFAFAAFVLSLLLPIAALPIAFLAFGLASIYSCVNSRYGLLANAMTATLAGMVPAYGMAVSGTISGHGVLLSVAIWWLVLAREIVFDIRDITSDSLTGKSSLPMLLGIRGTSMLVAASVAMSSIISITVGAGLSFQGFVFISLVMNMMSWYGVTAFLVAPNPRGIRVFQRATQYAFVAGIVGFALA